jgi:hypothetical protein
MRCGRFKASDGHLLCPMCGPEVELRQDATVWPATIAVRVAFNGSSPSPSRVTFTKSKVKATVRRGSRREQLTAQQDRGMWARDRQAREIRHMLIDRKSKTYVQRWRDSETGEVTFEKRGDLGDASVHGPASHQATAPVDPNRIIVHLQQTI